MMPLREETSIKPLSRESLLFSIRRPISSGVTPVSRAASWIFTRTGFHLRLAELQGRRLAWQFRDRRPLCRHASSDTVLLNDSDKGSHSPALRVADEAPDDVMGIVELFIAQPHANQLVTFSAMYKRTLHSFRNKATARTRISPKSHRDSARLLLPVRENLADDDWWHLTVGWVNLFGWFCSCLSQAAAGRGLCGWQHGWRNAALDRP